MAYEKISQSPAVADFIPLAEHQTQTPDTFFDGKPILHFHSTDAELRFSSMELSTQPDFAALSSSDPSTSEGEVKIPQIDVWVTSRYLTIYSRTKELGIQIPYPTISIHAQDGAAVLLELNLSEEDSLDEDLMFLQVRIVPGVVSTESPPQIVAASSEEPTKINGHSAPTDPAVQLYNAISACQELNPDPDDDEGDDDDDDDAAGADGFADSTAPGASGWITSENMADFMDANGNFRMPTALAGAGMTVIGDENDPETGSELGPGAGRRRTAAEVDAEEGQEQDETKWQRTD